MACIKIMRKVAAIIFFSLFAIMARSEDLIVSAASSLSNAFQEIATNFEAKYPDDNISLNFAGSGVLLQQIAKGAPVDVFASADQKTINEAASQQLINDETRQNFAKNTLVLVTSHKESIHLTTLKDLNSDAVKRIAIGNPAFVPAGNYAQGALMQAGQWQPLKDKFIYTQNVRQALDYVARDEVDVAFVYSSDALIMPDKIKRLFAVKTTQAITYPVAAIKDNKHEALAQRFITFLQSAESQKVLVKYGFLAVE